MSACAGRHGSIRFADELSLLFLEKDSNEIRLEAGDIAVYTSTEFLSPVLDITYLSSHPIVCIPK